MIRPAPLGTAVVMMIAALAGVIAGTDRALAHEPAGGLDSSHWWTFWNWDPLVVIGLLAFGGVYFAGHFRLWRGAPRHHASLLVRAAAFTGGLAVLAVALLSPVDAWSASLLWAHMVQHLLLLTVAPVLLVVGHPLATGMWALPRSWRRPVGRVAQRRDFHAGGTVLLHPLFAVGLHVGVLAIWHQPALYNLALESEAVHFAEHMAFFASSLLFWWVVLPAGSASVRNHGGGIVAVFAVALAGAWLGAILAFTPSVIYIAYGDAPPLTSLSPLEDQQIAGMVMWVPGGIIYTLAMAFLFITWLRASERRSAARERRFAETKQRPPMADASTDNRA